MNISIIITAILGYILVIAKEVPKRIIDVILKNYGYSFSVLSKNIKTYNIINEWLLSLNKNSINNNINVKEEWSCDGEKTYFSINYGQYMFLIDTFTVMILDKSIITNSMFSYDKIDIIIIGKNKNMYKSIISELINIDADKNMIRIFPSKELYHNYLAPRKSFADIFNPKIDNIKSYLDKWITQRPVFEEHGIIYKTGILLYGEPGTGKTSIARAITTYLNFNLHVINLRSYEKNEELIDRIIQIPQKSVILFEDIDCVVGNREEKNDDIKILDTLLNIIDGVISPNNVVFIATTNHIEKLDEALVRDGRFDLKVNVTNMNIDDAHDMCKYYNVSETILFNETFPIKPAYLQQKILRNI